MRLPVLLLFLAISTPGQDIRVEFDPNQPAIGPFPNDFLTTPGEQTKTGRRVALPLPDQDTRPSDFDEIAYLNTFDGFNPQARLTVKFSGPVNPDTLRDGIYYLWLDPVWEREHPLYPTGLRMGINRVVYDPVTYTAYAKPDGTLEQGRRYAIIVTTAVRDLAGNPVIADEGFEYCLRKEIGGEYCEAMSDAAALFEAGLEDARVVGGSVFTTMSVTSRLEALRDTLLETPQELTRGPVVEAPGIQSITLRKQTGAGGELEDEVFPVGPGFLAQAGIGRLVFGSLQHSQAAAGGMVPLDPLHFHALLPASPPPPGGYPVILAGHGLGDTRFGIPSLIAANYASRGYAVMAINAVGHGHGRETVLRLGTSQGVIEVPAPGRGVDGDGDGRIGASEGCIIVVPGSLVDTQTCMWRTAFDWMRVARAIRDGLDLDGDGAPDLDAARMSYFGQSLGAYYGTLFMAVEPFVRSAVLNTGGGTFIESARLSPNLRPFLQLYLANRNPILLNQGLDFEEEYTGLYEPVKVLSVPGAAAIQEVLERLEWMEAAGAPVNYAPHLRSATLDGVPWKRVLFQIARGDRTVPNPSNSMLIRAANLRETTSLYRHDLLRARLPLLPEDPHAFLAFQLNAALAPIASAAFLQAIEFLESGEDTVPEVNPLLRPLLGIDLFELPQFLPETTGFEPEP